MSWQIVVYKEDMWEEMTEVFRKTHSEHCTRVWNNLEAMSNYFEKVDTPASASIAMQLMQRKMLHDHTKLAEPIYVPYVWRYYRTYWKKNDEKDTRFTNYFSDRSLDQAIRDAIVYHVTHERHPPEWFLEHDEMSNVDIMEMVCDWYAMSQELNDDIDRWVNYVVPRRYHFQKKHQFVIDMVALVKHVTRA